MQGLLVEEDARVDGPPPQVSPPPLSLHLRQQVSEVLVVFEVEDL